MKSLLLSFIITLLCFSENVCSGETIVISGHPEAKPFTWVKEKHMLGSAVDLAESIFSGQKIGTRYEILPWKRALALLKDGDIDLLLALYRNETRAKDFEFTIPYADDPISVFVNKDDMFSLAKWDDLITKRGCVPLGESYGEKLDKFVKDKLTVDKAHDLDQCLRMLERGRIDYVLFSKYHVQMELAKKGLSDKIRALAYHMTSQKVHMAFSKKSPFVRLVPKINAEIERLEKEGLIEKLLQKAIVKASEEE